MITMKKLIKIVIVLTILAALIFAVSWFVNKNYKNSNKSFSIITTNFAAYDFTRTVIGDIKDINLEMLLPAGVDIHTYEPTPKDIEKISNADLFIYNGGESENWVNEILDSIGNINTLKMMDQVAVLEEDSTYIAEETHQSEDEEVEYDEHIWTSFTNATKIVLAISNKISELKPELKDNLINNANKFKDSASSLKIKYQNMINSAKRKIVVFGDKFPLRYFVEEMGLEYYAAFPGCAEETEASPKTITNLVEKIKADNIPVVLKIELSSGNIAKTIADETGAEILEFDTMHNVSKDNFNSNVNFLKIMENNYIILQKALN